MSAPEPERRVRRQPRRIPWYILGGAFIAISVTFPLFLIARQMRIGNTDPMRVRAIAMVLVPVFAVAVLGLVIWVDMA
jgi:hypothetical protein